MNPSDEIPPETKVLFRASQATGHLVHLLELPSPPRAQIENAIARGARLDWVSLGHVPLVLHAIKQHDRGPYQVDREQALLDKIEPLLHAGAPILRSPAGETPLSNTIIALGDAPRVIQALLDAGADPNEPTTGPQFGALDQAVSSGAVDSAARLLAGGAHPNGLSGASVRLAVDYHRSRKSGDTAARLLRLLLDAGADPNPEGYRSALFMAIDADMYAAAIALLEAGADPDQHEPMQSEGDHTAYLHAMNRLTTYEVPDPQTGLPVQMGVDADALSPDGVSLNQLLAELEVRRMECRTQPAPGTRSAPRL